MKRLKKKDKIILFLSLLFFFSMTFLAILNHGLIWDENVYLSNARSWISNSNFQEDFRFPLLELIIALFWLICGESLLLAKIIMIIITCLLLLIFYLLLKKLVDNKYLVYYFLIFLLTPVLVYWSFRVYPDVLATFLILSSFYFIVLNQHQKIKFHLWFYAGLSAGLAFLAKFPMILFSVSFIIFFVVINLKYREKLKSILLFLVGNFAALIPWFLFNYFKYHNFIWDFIQQYTVVSQYTVFQSPLIFVYNILKNLHVHFFFFLVAIYFFVSQIRSKWKNRDIAIFSFIFLTMYSLFFMFFVKVKDSRYILPVLPFLFFFSFDGIEKICTQIRRKKWITTFLIIIVSFSLLNLIPTIYHVGNEIDCNKNNPILYASQYLKNNTENNDYIISNCWPYFGYFNNLKVASLWCDNISTLKKLYDPKYVIFCNYSNLNYDKNILDHSAELMKEKEFNNTCGQEVILYAVR